MARQPNGSHRGRRGAVAAHRRSGDMLTEGIYDFRVYLARFWKYALVSRKCHPIDRCGRFTYCRGNVITPLRSGVDALLGGKGRCGGLQSKPLLTLENLGHISEVEGVVTLLRCGEQLPRDGVEHLDRRVHHPRREPYGRIM